VKENGREKKAIKIESCHQHYFTILSSKAYIYEYQKTEVVVLMGLYNIQGENSDSGSKTRVKVQHGKGAMILLLYMPFS